MGNNIARKLLSATLFTSVAVAGAIAGERGVSFSALVPASKDSLTFGPDHAYAEGFGDSAGLHLVAGNTGSQTSTLRFEAFDAAFRPINSVDLPAPTALYPGETRTFLAIVPIMEDVKNRVRICAILKPSNENESRLCGRYIARRR